MTIDQDRTIKYSYFYALSSKVSINDQILTVSEFWRFLETKHPPPKTLIRADTNMSNRPTRAFAPPEYSNVLDFGLLFSQDHIQFIKDFDMDDIGRFKIRTVKSIQTKDLPAYTRIITSALHGVIQAAEKGDMHDLALTCRFLYLIPPMLLRAPAKAATQRIDAFLLGDLKLCARGLLSVPDNYVPRAQRTPTQTRHQAAATCVFDGQFSKALTALMRQETSTTHETRMEAMIAKHPTRSPQDHALIQELPGSLPSRPILTETVYNTIRKPTRRGIAPGPNGDRFEYLQSTIHDPYGNVDASSLLHVLTRFVNLEKDGRLPDEWYDYNTSAILIAQGDKMRPLGMYWIF